MNTLKLACLSVFLFLRIRVPILLDVVEYALQRKTERVLVVVRIFLLERRQVTVQIVRLSRGTQQERPSDVPFLFEMTHERNTRISLPTPSGTGEHNDGRETYVVLSCFDSILGLVLF